MITNVKSPNRGVFDMIKKMFVPFSIVNKISVENSLSLFILLAITHEHNDRRIILLRINNYEYKIIVEGYV